MTITLYALPWSKVAHRSVQWLPDDPDGTRPTFACNATRSIHDLITIIEVATFSDPPPAPYRHCKRCVRCARLL